MLSGGTITNPHPLIMMYLGTARWSSSQHKVLPWSGGWLDWDLHETKGMEVLEELITEIKNLNERRAEAKKAAAEHRVMAPGAI